MSNFICPDCHKLIIDSDNGFINGCEHFQVEDIIEMSGKQMSDGASQLEADKKAIEIYLKYRKGQKNLF